MWLWVLSYFISVMGLFKQIMALRVKFVRDMVKNGTHVLLTDIDNVFSRHIDPVGFVEEGYDVYHAYEMRYPTNLYRKHGFVFCSGHLFFRSSEATLRFLDMAVKRCGDKCDDQVMYNGLFWELDIEWDGRDPPAHPEAIRVVSHTADKTNAGLLVESATGRSRLTNHTFKIWDRDFAWRLSGGLPELCPSKNNWVGMPSVNGGQTDKIQLKLALFDLWDDYCLNPEADKKRVRIACNTSVADCELCKSPMCKACWIDYGQDQEERTCMIMDANAAENPFHVKDDWVALSDGSTVKFCGSNKWGNKSGGITCNKRVQYVIKRHRMSEKDAKISVLENGCSCSVGDDKGKKSISRKGRDREEEYLQQFASRKKHFQDISLLPAKTIAQRYDIPETSRSVKCLLNGTTHIGWIPRAKDAEQSQVLIPRLIFQSWKTNHLTYNVCQNVLAWTKLNPEYDYMLFDDKAADLFIQKEYGNDIFDSFDCVNVGAARCDVWRLMIIYIFGGIYFDIDVRPKSAFRFWGFGNRTVVTGRGCNNRRHPTGCAHQWGLIYVPFHEVIQNAIEETLGNLAKKDATHVYGVSFWSFYNAWTKGPFNSSYMLGWGEYMGDRVTFSQEDAKAEMISLNGHWPAANGKKDKIWKSECLS